MSRCSLVGIYCIHTGWCTFFTTFILQVQPAECGQIRVNLENLFQYESNHNTAALLVFTWWLASSVLRYSLWPHIALYTRPGTNIGLHQDAEVANTSELGCFLDFVWIVFIAWDEASMAGPKSIYQWPPLARILTRQLNNKPPQPHNRSFVHAQHPL